MVGKALLLIVALFVGAILFGNIAMCYEGTHGDQAGIEACGRGLLWVLGAVVVILLLAKVFGGKR